MPSTIASGDGSESKLKEISGVASELRKSFKTGKTKTAKWRRSQLKALQTLIKEGRDQLTGGMKADLHKSDFEGNCMELNLVEHEIQHHLDHLDQWMKPEVVPNNLLNVPGWSRVYKDPYGVVLIMSPWNYPCYLMLCPLIGAISAGNCIMLRSGNYSQETSKALVKLIGQYMDSDCIKIAKQQDRYATKALLDQRWDTIFFTGGTTVGKIVTRAAAENLTPTILELGGKSPCIVDKSADLNVAAKRVIWGAFTNCGQTCVRPDYVMVHEDVADKFVALAKNTVKEFYGENPKETEFFGRLINERSQKRVSALIQKSEEYVVTKFESDEKEKYISPTILDFKTDKEAFVGAAIMKEEIFGPALPIYRYNDLDEVLDFINDNEKPLALYCFSTNSSLNNKVLTGTSSGGANINDVMMHLSNPDLPFGGVGCSGMGSYHGKLSFDAFTHNKGVLFKTNFFDVPARYPPYTKGKQTLMGLATKIIPAWQIKILKMVQLIVFFYVAKFLGKVMMEKYGYRYLRKTVMPWAVQKVMQAMQKQKR